MSLNMYLGETDAQKESMNNMCIDIILAMEKVQKAIQSFSYALSLQGRTYDSAKIYMNKVYFPLTQGMIWLCEELIRQNDAYPEDFRSNVASTDVVETEIREQIEEINRIINNIQELDDILPLFQMKIIIYEQIKRSLEQKLSDLATFNMTSSSNYDVALQLASSVSEGIQDIQDGNAFNKQTGIFDTANMDLGWASDLSDTYYKRLAQDRYGDYIGSGEGKIELEKVIEILKYEQAYPEDAEKLTNFLSPAEVIDSLEIKYITYTAEEPYRTLSLHYLENFELIILTDQIREQEEIDSDGVFRYWEDAIYVDIDKVKSDGRGDYYTYFHEIAHAFDHYFVQENIDLVKEMSNDPKSIDKSSSFTDVFMTNEKILTEYMYKDFENNVRKELRIELYNSPNTNLSYTEKNRMIDNIANNLLNQDADYSNLTEEEKKLQKNIQRKYKLDLLDGSEHNTASDVYGGVTNHAIRGGAGHSDDYWIDENGNRIREPNREGFAEYYGRIMADDGEDKPGIESVEEFLPSSKEHMDEIFRVMDMGLAK